MRLSPLNQRRWANFRKNRRGYWSLWIFLVLFLTTLGAEFIANEKPLLIRYDNQWCLSHFSSLSRDRFWR